MHFLGHYPASDIQWHLYRRLELIPASISHRTHAHASLTYGLGWVWKRLIQLLIAELEAEGRLEEYFERCWAIDMATEGDKGGNTLRKLLILLD